MLNENQSLAVNHIYGPCLTLAGPGSGKTTVLVERILNLIRCGINPEKILVITFTKDAALEMKTRYNKKCDSDDASVTFGTFHSVFFSMLKSHIKFQGYTLISGIKKLALFDEVLRLTKLKDLMGDDVMALEKYVSYFYNANQRIHPDAELVYTKENFETFIRALEKRKDVHKYMDFDDLLVKTKEILEGDKEFLRACQKKYEFFLVDEFQDINEVQFCVLKLLSKNHPCGCENVFAVGDDDQSIYGFRGASPKYMLGFSKEFLGAKEIFLDTNYRSCFSIVDSAKRLIEENNDRFVKDIKAFSKDEGCVSIMHFENPSQEAENICKILMKEISKDRLSDTAVLYRNRSRADAIATLLKLKGIEFFTDAVGKSVKETDTCKDVISYLRLCLNCYKRSDIIRIMNKPNRDLGRGGLFKDDTTIDEWQNFYPKGSSGYMAIEGLKAQLRLLYKLSPYSFVNYMKRGPLIDSNPEDFLAIMTLALEYRDKEEFLNELLREDKEVSNKRKDEKISLFTFHGSKGLEFDRVFILDAVEGITPSKNAKTNEELEEERRMFYVAMTRAKKELIICVPQKIDEEEVNESRFIINL